MARVLVVDDDEQVRQIVRRILTVNGHAVELANDGDAALELIQKGSYDLLIIDRTMPAIGGIEAVSIIRTSSKFKGLKIIMFTGDSVTSAVDDAYKAGVDGYLVKPVEAVRFMAKVNSVLGGGGNRT